MLPTPQSLIHSLPTPSPVFAVAQEIPQPTPLPSCYSPNEVLVALTTTLVIPDFDRFYSFPVSDFKPSYIALRDGSLVTQVYMRDIYDASINIFTTGVLLMLFTRNIFISGGYIRRAKVQKKMLLYILLVSQLLASVSLVPVVASQFSQLPSCTTVGIISCAATTTSLAFLIAGILGFKAYKCLDDSLIVLFTLFGFTCAATTLVIFDLNNLKAERRLTGSCVRTSSVRYLTLYILIQLAETFFICCCFLFAIWKSRNSAVSRSRMSLQLSMLDDSNSGTRQHLKQIGFKLKSVYFSICRRRNQAYSPNIPFVKSHTPAIRKQQLSPIRIPATASEKQAEFGFHVRTSSPFPSFRRISRFMPTIALFRAVLRDEIWYSAFITATCVIIAVLALVGLNVTNSLTVNGWLLLNWAIISLLAVHSSERVVRRHEREALLMDACSWSSHTRAVPRRRRVPPLVSPYSPQSSNSDTQRLRRASSWDSVRSTYTNTLSKSFNPVETPSEGFDRTSPPCLENEFPSSGECTPLRLTIDSGKATHFYH